MIPYYILVGLPIVLSFFRYDDKKLILNKRFPLFVFFLTFIILLSLRSVECGIDLLNYKNKFQLSGSISFKSIFDLSIIEPGYELLVSLTKSITDNFQVFLSLCAILSVLPIMVLYLQETEHNLVTIALFVGIAPFTIFFSGLRQSIAIGISAICYMMCKKNKLIIFLLLVLVAFLFHQSALIVLLMYPLTHVKITKKWIPLIAALYVVCLMFNKQIFGFLIGINQKYESRYVISDTGSYTFLALLFILTAFAFIILDDGAVEVFGLRNLMVLSLFLQCFAPINSVAMRLNYYYLIFIPLLIPKIIDNCQPRYRQVAFISIFVFIYYFIFWFFKEAYYGANILHAFPYVPFWE